MSRTGEIERRAFLRGLGSAAALGLAAPALVTCLAGCGRSGALAVALSDFFADPESARAVGREFLEGFPDEADAGTLVARLAGAQRPAWEALAATQPERLAEALRARHREDFAHERVLRIRGWVLSETEVRLCALAALGHQSA
jgi:predicted protein tyrosine phosphatase